MIQQAREKNLTVEVKDTLWNANAARVCVRSLTFDRDDMF
jgi:hypothetical protein